MSEKTIEVVSIHKGPISLTLPNDESRTVIFEDKGHVGYAKVDHDEASVLLRIGRPHYWKPGEGENTELSGGNPAEPAKPDTPATLAVDTYDNVPNVAALKDLLAACTDKSVLMQIIALESQKEKPRQSWMKELEARLTQLEKPGEGENTELSGGNPAEPAASGDPASE